MARETSSMGGREAEAVVGQAAKMRLGFVGVGRHAQKMAAAFRECGAEIVAYCRKSLEPAEGFGPRKNIEWVLDFHNCDAIVCCAPPDVGTGLAIDAEIYQQDLCISKPFPMVERMWQAEHMSHQLVIDLWRLYSPAWQALKADLQGKIIKSIHVGFYGNGPVRKTHSGLLDYGPHALAFALDIGLSPELTWINPGEGRWEASSGPVIIQTGNGFDVPRSRVRVELSDGAVLTWEEHEGRHRYGNVIEHSASLALKSFCRAFMAGEPSDTLRISCEAMRLLRQAEPW